MWGCSSWTTAQHLTPSYRTFSSPNSLPLSTCNWIKSFLTSRPQSVRLGPHHSSTITLSTGSPQGCVLSHLLYALYTHDCSPAHPTNRIKKYVDDTTVVVLICNGDKTAYRAEVNPGQITWPWMSIVAGLLLTTRFPGALRHRTRVDVIQYVYLLEMAGGISRGDVTRCHDSRSSSSVCGDGWFILGAMIAHAPQVCSPTQPESNQSDSGQVRL